MWWVLPKCGLSFFKTDNHFVSQGLEKTKYRIHIYLVPRIVVVCFLQTKKLLLETGSVKRWGSMSPPGAPFYLQERGARGGNEGCVS